MLVHCSSFCISMERSTCILQFSFCLLGVINGTAPNPVRLSELCERLGRVVGRPSWLPVPEFALKAVLGEGASVVMLIVVPYRSLSLYIYVCVSNSIFMLTTHAYALIYPGASK